MNAGDPALSSASAAGERYATHTTRLGGRDVSTQVESWSLERAYATDLPDAMRAFNGSTSAQLDVTVTGTGGRSAPALYGPWAPRSSGDVARPGQSVVAGWGINGGVVDAFRGTVRNRSAQSGTDLVRVSALDGAERVRQPAALPRPDGALSDRNGKWTGAASPVWVVDHLLRGAGIHTAPPPRAGSILYASLHGGAAANVGYLEGMNGDSGFWQKTDAPFESALEGGFSSPTTITYIPALLPVNRRSDGLWFEFWANTDANLFSEQTVRIQTEWLAGATPHYVAMDVNFTTAKLTAWSGTNIDPTKNQALQWTWDKLTTRGTFHIGWWFTWSTTGVPTLAPVITQAGSVMSPDFLSNGTFGTVPAAAGALYSVSFAVQNMRTECYQVSQMTAKPSNLAAATQDGTWKRTAALDMPVLPMRAIPAVSGSAWDVITEIARATLATAEFDSDGFFRWRNHTRWATVPTVPDVVVTSARELGSLTMTEEIDACRNHCTVKWSNWSRVEADGITEVQEYPSPVAIAAGATLTRTLLVDVDMYDPRAPKTAYSADTGSPNRLVIRAGSAASSATVAGAVEISVRRNGGAVTITMRNRSASTVYYHGVSLIALVHAARHDPVPSLWSARDTVSQSYYGVQVYEHDAKVWVQDTTSASTLAVALREAGVYPPPLLQSVEILPDPRIRLGDVVRVVDSTGAQLDTLAWVIGNKAQGSGGKITQTLTLRGTKANGVPKDSGLTPDPPTRPNAPLPT
ncbi:hypothetical protein [Streptomyces zagrosensis]|uniref:Uncharacterized protein n=1 Tax=Streptomyces zagrosensis TaxID=1042984 RepID=A0A7W9UX68_9ACTN|nr:hypothetical protein [Streptomyces zagrosensis]MBB5934578.1 hypothetical protein [Streptomyces zagrosensis]